MAAKLGSVLQGHWQFKLVVLECVFLIYDIDASKSGYFSSI